MGGEQAAQRVLATVKRDNIEADGGNLVGGRGRGIQAADPRAIRSGRQSVLRHRAAMDDGIIAPQETRRVLALAFSAALNAPI